VFFSRRQLDLMKRADLAIALHQLLARACQRSASTGR
jgi:hypothetical protein